MMQCDGASIIQMIEFLWVCCKGFDKFGHVAVSEYGPNGLRRHRLSGIGVHVF